MGPRLIFIMIFFTTALLAQPKIDLTEGSIFVLGSLTLDYEMQVLDETEHRLKMKSNIGGGYLVMDRLAISLSIPADWKFTPSSRGSFGLKLSTTYFFDIVSMMFPYLGINVTPKYSMSERAFQLLAGAEAGILVSMSENVALDFGINPEVFFKLYDVQKWKFTLPAGFLGIRAVF
jgi:hypothetical protein